MEAPSSWLTRAALAQGIQVSELLAFLGIPRHADPDVAFLADLFPSISRRCGLRPSDFAVARHLLLATERSGVSRSKLLLPWRRGRARYRICPQCMNQERTPYVPIHCRFSVWRFCPEHGCLLEDACWSCNVPVRLPASLVGASSRKREITYLSQCLKCGWAHGKTPAIDMDRWLERFSKAEMLLLQHGRATLAALLQGRVDLGKGAQPLRKLKLVDQLGLLPTGQAAPSASLWRRRRELESQSGSGFPAGHGV